jgi:hypothetical protein
MDSEIGHMFLVVFKPLFAKLLDSLLQHPIRIFHSHIFLYISVGRRGNKLLINLMACYMVFYRSYCYWVGQEDPRIIRKRSLKKTPPLDNFLCYLKSAPYRDSLAVSGQY